MASMDNAGISLQPCAQEQGVMLGRFVPFETLLTEHDVMTRGGDLIRTWRLDGLRCDVEGAHQALEQHEAFCSLLQKLAGGRFALWAHRIRRPRHAEAEPVAADVRGTVSEQPPASRLLIDAVYLTVLVRSVPRRSPRFLRIPKRASRSVGGCHSELLSLMNDTALLVAETLSELQPQLLGDYFFAGRHYSEVLEFLAFLVNGTWARQKVTPALLYKSLPRAHVAFAGEEIVFRQGGEIQHAVAFGIANYPQSHLARQRNLRLPHDCEFIETQSFSPGFERLPGSSMTAYLHGPDAGSVDAVRIPVRTHGLGEYHYSLVLFGKNAKDTEHRAAAVAYVLGASVGVAVVRCDMSDAAWFSQWPGTWNWRARQARLSSRTFAVVAPDQVVPDSP